MKKIISLMRRSLFWKIYIIVIAVFVCLLIVGSILFSVWLSDYESSQNTIEVDRVVSLFENGEYAEIISHTDVVKAGLVSSSDYEAKLREAAEGKTLSYVKTFSYDRFESPSYIIKADGEDLCKLTLKKSDKTSSFGFSLYEFDYISDFAFSDIKLVFLAPEGSTPYIDGKPVDDIFKKMLAKDQQSAASYALDAESAVIYRYEISGLLEQPENVEVRNGKGAPMALKINSSNEIVAELIGVTINAPVGFTVKVNGVQLGEKYITSDAAENSNVKYLINEDDKNALSLFHTYYVDGFFEVPSVEVLDESGGHIACAYNSETNTFDVGISVYTLRIPSNYTVTVNGTDISSSDNWKSESVSIDSLANIPSEYFTAPEMITYKIAVLSGIPSVDVKNFDAQTVQTEYDEGSMTFTCDFAASDSVRDEYMQIAIDGAKAYAGFMSNDISMDAFLSRIVRGTQMYKDMSEYRQYWYTDHDSTSFENLEAYELRTYGENCFSCAVYFDYWIFGQRGKPDFKEKLPTNTRIWYVRTEGRWMMADIEIFERN